MTSRDLESTLLSRCTKVAREDAEAAQDQREANVFRLAAMLVQTQFPDEAKCLSRASECYFALHPNQQLPSGEVIKRGWIISMPRLRDMLSRQLRTV